MTTSMNVGSQLPSVLLEGNVFIEMCAKQAAEETQCTFYQQTKLSLARLLAVVSYKGFSL